MAEIFLPEGFAQLLVTFDKLGIGSTPTNVLTVVLDGDPGVQGFIDLAQATADAYAPAISEDYGVKGVGIVVGTVGGVPSFSFDTGVTAVGTGNWSSAPPNCTSLIQKRTALPGRQGRGRIYVTGANELAADAAGLYNGSQQTINQDFATELDTIAGDPAFDITAWAVPHAFATELIPTAVIGHVPSPYVATQRRRLRR